VDGATTTYRRHPLRVAAITAGVIVVVAAIAAVGLYVWLVHYAPLDADGNFAPGPGLGADVQPVLGSGGKPVFIPAYRKGRPFDTAFTLHNSGRFAVTVTGFAGSATADTPLAAVEVLATDSSAASADPANLEPFRRLRLDPGDSAILVVRWGLDCSQRPAETSADAVRLHYRYLSRFSRSQTVTLPFAVTLRCEGGPPANP
jgi:hypothetical protein